MKEGKKGWKGRRGAEGNGEREGGGNVSPCLISALEQLNPSDQCKVPVPVDGVTKGFPFSLGKAVPRGQGDQSLE